MTVLAARTRDTVTFHAVELFKEAYGLQQAGIDIISLGIGEPDFTAAPQVVAAMERAAHRGLSGYSAPAGLPALREAIAEFYGKHLGAPVDASRVIVTSGASGALLLAAGICPSLRRPAVRKTLPLPSRVWRSGPAGSRQWSGVEARRTLVGRPRRISAAGTDRAPARRDLAK